MKIQFREPASREELESLFRLRHKVYSEDPFLNSMVNPSTVDLDMNIYDLNALHFGAYRDNEAIACIRMTTDNKTHITTWAQELAIDTRMIADEVGETYPFQNYYPDANWSKEFIKSLHGRKIGEVGKLAIHQDHRSKGLLPEFISAFVSYCKDEHSFSTGFGSCSLQLEKFYLKFGFTRAEGSAPFTHKGLPEAVIVRFDS